MNSEKNAHTHTHSVFLMFNVLRRNWIFFLIYISIDRFKNVEIEIQSMHIINCPDLIACCSNNDDDDDGKKLDYRLINKLIRV